MTKIPGVVKLHKIITQQCRARPRVLVLANVKNAVNDAIIDLDNSWPKESDMKIHVVVTLERP